MMPKPRKEFERRLPVTRTSQSVPVFQAHDKIRGIAEFLGVSPNHTAFARALDLKTSTVREALNKSAFTPALMRQIKEMLDGKRQLKFSPDWIEWRDPGKPIEVTTGRSDSSEAFLRRFRAENGHCVEAPAPPRQHQAPSSEVAPRRALRDTLYSLDLWTPGQSADAIMHHLGGSLGPNEADLLLALSQEAIAAIGNSDFQRQKEIADETIELGEAAPETPLLGEGLYLKAEALRLLADFEADYEQQRIMRTAAAELYGQAQDVLGGDPRAIRGHARTLESLGDLRGGFKGFERAYAAVETLRLDVTDANRLTLTHEAIRTLRHKILCLAGMHVTSPPSTREAMARAEEIRRLIIQSEAKHQHELALFHGKADNWLLIEWFTSLVLHAKAWAAIGNHSMAAKRLQWSLDARLRLLPREGPLTPVELGNLHWWSTAVYGVQDAFEPAQRAPLADLLQLIKLGADRASIQRAGAQFLRSGSAPFG